MKSKSHEDKGLWRSLRLLVDIRGRLLPFLVRHVNSTRLQAGLDRFTEATARPELRRPNVSASPISLHPKLVSLLSIEHYINTKSPSLSTVNANKSMCIRAPFVELQGHAGAITERGRVRPLLAHSTAGQARARTV